MKTFQQAQAALRKRKNPRKVVFLMRYFKTGKGEYAEGDKFLGITVPLTRSIAKDFKDMSIADALKLLESTWHEERLMATFILDDLYKQAVKNNNAADQKKIFEGYLKRVAKYVNNWDLVDLSARDIVGRYLEDKPRGIIHKLSKSKNLWEKRVSVLSTFWFIARNDYDDALKVAETLLSDSHDLIHKAVGWMLREIGNRSSQTEKKFLDKHAKNMSRTTLRYAIEKFPENLRKKYLAIKRADIVK